ncbi:hypothetical protein D3C74_370040 [compost metagenome]
MGEELDRRQAHAVDVATDDRARVGGVRRRVEREVEEDRAERLRDEVLRTRGLVERGPDGAGGDAVGDVRGGVLDHALDERAGEVAALLEAAQHVAEDRAVLLDRRELCEDVHGAASGARLVAQDVALVLADQDEDVLVARSPQAVLRSEVMDDEARADPGVGGERAQRDAEALAREAGQGRVADASASREVRGVGRGLCRVDRGGA